MPKDRYELSDDARDDLNEIFRFIAKDNEFAALKLVTRLLDIIANLQENPLIGRERGELKEGLRSFPEGNYLIFYRLWAGHVLIVRVLHAARDLDEIFS